MVTPPVVSAPTVDGSADDSSNKSVVNAVLLIINNSSITHGHSVTNVQVIIQSLLARPRTKRE